ncbi:MAG: 4-alpha-glucanotransferase [Pseudomonadota bacterium]
MSEALLALARARGVLPEWRDLSGALHVTAPETALALLRAMDAIDDITEAAERLAALEAERAARPLPPVHLATAWAPSLLRAPTDARTWRLTFEQGATAEGRADGAVELPALPPGLHRLSLDDRAEDCLVIAAPDRAPTLADRLGRDRAWGATGAITALWQEAAPPGAGAIGSYADLAHAAEALAAHGAAFLGINPVHSLGHASIGHSPYSPGHRGFLDTRPLLSLAGAPDGGDALIDYPAHRLAHDKALQAQFATEIAEPGVASRLAAFRAQHGTALEHFALFEALSARLGPDWRSWPAGYEHPETPAATAFAATEARALTFHAWAQMRASEALGAAQHRALQAGMALGLYADLAVGVRPDGAEVWARPGVFARGVSLGAPPDMFAPEGQSWGLAPFSPPGLEADRYTAFAETIRAATAHAGVLRIDHVLGLERTFWVPLDGTPGGYVRSDRAVLLAILRLEAARRGTVIVGEDLGVVPEGLRDALSASGIYGCSVAMFERWEGRLRAPWHFRAETLASFGTHDTPTLKGWWQGRDIDWAAKLSRADAEEAARQRAARAEDRRTIATLLAEARILPEGIDPTAPPEDADAPLLDAIHALMARSSAALVAVQLDDVLGTLEQPNIPGTIHEHPNWRRRHEAPVERLAEHPSLQRIAAEMRAFGRG